MSNRKSALTAIIIVLVLALSACTQAAPAPASSQSPVTASSASSPAPAPAEEGLVVTSSMQLEFAENFAVDYCEGGYKLITIIPTSQRFLVIPEGAEIPAMLDEDIIPLQMPVNNLLISSTPTMSLITAIGGLEHVTQVTSDIDSWHIPEVKAAMEAGEIAFIGDYKAPDFELVAVNAAPVSVFSAMLSGAPEVEDKLGELEIPVLLDQSTYESHPLARTEWMKLYGAMLGLEDNAQKVFAEQAAAVEALTANQAIEKTAAIFYITSNGNIYARNAGDYFVKMLELAGGSYIIADMEPEKSGNTQMEAEAFYSAAKDADYIIYVHSMGGRPADMTAFTTLNEVLGDFKAVQEDNVWCTTPDFFQIAHTLGFMIEDINKMLTGVTDADEYTYLFRLR